MVVTSYGIRLPVSYIANKSSTVVCSLYSRITSAHLEQHCAFCGQVAGGPRQESEAV
jgi:hypothetical protein